MFPRKRFAKGEVTPRELSVQHGGGQGRGHAWPPRLSPCGRLAAAGCSEGGHFPPGGVRAHALPLTRLFPELWCDALVTSL